VFRPFSGRCGTKGTRLEGPVLGFVTFNRWGTFRLSLVERPVPGRKAERSRRRVLLCARTRESERLTAHGTPA
jgi:hypothetical protein